MYDPYDLAYVGKVVEIVSDEEAIVDFNGLRRRVCTSLVNVKVGDYVLVHAGYAIKVLSEREVEEALKEILLNLLKE